MYFRTGAPLKIFSQFRIDLRSSNFSPLGSPLVVQTRYKWNLGVEYMCYLPFLDGGGGSIVNWWKLSILILDSNQVLLQWSILNILIWYVKLYNGLYMEYIWVIYGLYMAKKWFFLKKIFVAIMKKIWLESDFMKKKILSQ